jgi:predicted nucleotidyltransferase
MNFFNAKFPKTHRPSLPTGSMFKPGEVVWDDKDGSYFMAPAAAVCFMLHQAYAPDSELSNQRHAQNRAMVRAGIDLAAERGFTQAAQLLGLLNTRSANHGQLRALCDQVLEHVTPEVWMRHVLGAEPAQGAQA